MIKSSSLKNYTGTVITIFIAVAVMLGAMVFIFYLLLGGQLENRYDYLNRQAEISASAISGELELFSRDVHFFLSTLDAQKINNPGEGTAKKQIYAFLAHNRELVKKLTVYQEESGFTAKLNTSGDLQFKSEEGGYPDFISESGTADFRFLPERNVLIFDEGNRVFLFNMNIGAFITDRLETYFSGTSGYQLVLTPENEMARVSQVAASDFSLTPELRERLNSRLQEGFFHSQEETVLIDNKEKDALLSFYPLDVFNQSYGLLFAVPESSVISDFRNSFLFIGSVILLLTILIVYVLTRNIRSLQAYSDRLKESKKVLEELVDQQKLLFEYSDDFTYRHDENQNYDYVSENVQKVLGYTPEEFSTSEFRQFTRNPINNTAFEATKKVLKGKSETESFYAEIRDKTGSAKILEIREKPFKSNNGTKNGVIGIAKDVTEKFMSDQKFRMLFEYSSDPHLIYDHDRGIIDCNDATVKLLEARSKEDILGKKPFEFSPERQPDGRLSEYKADEMLNIAVEKGRHTFEWTHSKSTGVDFPVEVTLTPVVINEENVILTVWHDLTERKRVEEVLIEGRQKAESLAQSKQQFLSSMSHEIRTPLNAVIGYTKLLLESNPRHDQEEKLKSLQFSADNLLSLVTDILDHSLIESGKIKFASEPFSIKSKMHYIHEMMNMKAEDKPVEVNLKVDEKVPDTVVGDSARLNQILVNLCSNAIKFTNEGQVDIQVDLLGQTKNHNELRFSVKDTGIGIPEKRQEAIFNTFEQADLNILNTYGGTGLGLAITKNLVEMQGGTISVKSEEGEGSLFTVTMNFLHDDTEKPTVEKPDQVQDLNGAKVLLVEDNPINQKIAEQFLKKWGARVTIAEDGKEGLEKVSEKGYDFVLMDIQMPEMDGYEATKAIRKIEEDYFQKLPIICLTADAFTEVRERVLEAGMNDYITKPINSDNFFKTISKYYKPKVK